MIKVLKESSLVSNDVLLVLMHGVTDSKNVRDVVKILVCVQLSQSHLSGILYQHITQFLNIKD